MGIKEIEAPLTSKPPWPGDASIPNKRMEESISNNPPAPQVSEK